MAEEFSFPRDPRLPFKSRALFFFPLWTTGHCYFHICQVGLLEGAISEQVAEFLSYIYSASQLFDSHCQWELEAQG